jgi:membrane protein
MSLNRIATLARRTVSAWSDDYAPSMGAALAYYTLFSIAPLLLIVMSVAGLVFGADAAQGRLYGELRDLMGEQPAAAVQALMQNVNRPAQGLLATGIGGVVLLVGAMSVFGELQDALDRIWRAPLRPGGSSVVKLLRARLLSFLMIVGVGVLLLAAIVVSAVLAAVDARWSRSIAAAAPLLQGLDLVVSFALTTVGFALLYKVIPRVRIQWRDVWIGAAVTALLFTLGKFAIGLYIGRASFASGFGAAASLAVVLVWMYYSAQIFLLGAEFTWVYAHECGSRASGASASAEGSRPRSVAEGSRALVESRAAIAEALSGRRDSGGEPS